MSLLTIISSIKSTLIDEEKKKKAWGSVSRIYCMLYAHSLTTPDAYSGAIKTTLGSCLLLATWELVYNASMYWYTSSHTRLVQYVTGFSIRIHPLFFSTSPWSRHGVYTVPHLFLLFKNLASGLFPLCCLYHVFLASCEEKDSGTKSWWDQVSIE